jgi:hypothetical protein
MTQPKHPMLESHDMTDDKPTNPEIDPAIEPDVAEAREIIRNSDELVSSMISLLVKNDTSGEVITSYLVVELGIAAERAETLYKHVYNAGSAP